VAEPPARLGAQALTAACGADRRPDGILRRGPPAGRTTKSLAAHVSGMASRNVGGRDRLVRAVLAVALAALAVVSLRDGDRTTAALAAVAALGLGVNAVTCFCGVNAVLGVNTTTTDSED